MDLFLLLILTRLLPLRLIVVIPIHICALLVQQMCRRFTDRFQRSITAATGGET
jgi:hypothetical protein